MNREEIINRLKECVAYYEDNQEDKDSVFYEDREIYNANIEEMVDLIKRL